MQVDNGAAGPAAAAAGPQGKVMVTVKGENLAAGITLASKAKGNVTTSSPRVESGMPLATAP